MAYTVHVAETLAIFAGMGLAVWAFCCVADRFEKFDRKAGVKRGERVSAVACTVVRSVLEDWFGRRVGAQYWLSRDDDREVVFVASSKAVFHGNRVRVSGVVSEVRKVEDGRVFVWLEKANMFEPEVKTHVLRGVKVRY